MPHAHFDSIDLHYRIDGDEGRPWLVLSHGLGLDLGMWDPQIPALAKAYRVLRYDTRGHGASTTPDAPFDIERLGCDVIALLDHVGAGRAHFCGFSMGGVIGIWVGIHAQRRLHSLILAHTAALIGPRAMWNERIAMVNARGMQAVSDAAMTRWFTPAFIAGEPAIVDGLKAGMERTSATGYVQCCAAIRDADFRSQLGAIRTPTLVISGLHDAATTPADGSFLEERIAGARAVDIDAAHLSNFERPAAFTAALGNFLDAAERAPMAAEAASSP